MRFLRLALFLALSLPLGVRAGELENRLLDAAAAGERLLVEALLDNGAEVDGRDRLGGPTPLTLAARFGRPAVVGLLIDRGADVNARAKRGWSPLLAAVRSLDGRIIAELLGAGAAPDAADDDG
ncbi:MAG: ankyrin repeat domain-containing protein, partial [Proteobacteria bacterium]|nr:ankyrin repeat domain-containing protein [Pseudomonadota bacterium]